MALKQIEDKSAEWKDRRKYENEKRRIWKDGCVWRAGPSCVVGQDVEGGEGPPDKPTSSTWVPLTLYICRASAQSQPVSTASPYGGFTFCFVHFIHWKQGFTAGLSFASHSGAGELQQEPLFG